MKRTSDVRTSTTLSPAVRQYLIVTGNYWAFTLTDGALRMLVLLHFNDLGYGPLEIAMLFVFYEAFGVITNLVGGWLGARLGLNRTMNIGLATQVVALSMLLVPAGWLTVPWVMAAQALSGIAKDLNKMSAKSTIKLLLPEQAQHAIYRWVALLTGSKNALKGIGFFAGGALLTLFGFRGAIAIMASALLLVFLFSLLTLQRDLGRASNAPRFSHLLSRSRAVNELAAARLFLFGARDVWFVVALPVYLATTLHWSHWSISGFLACWIIGYGLVQSLAPYVTGSGQRSSALAISKPPPGGRSAFGWAALLSFVPALIAILLSSGYSAQPVLIAGLLVFGVLFAINSSLHSYLIVSYARSDGVSLDVGFYYMANAMGRLLGTVLSGWLFQRYGLATCLWASSASVACAALLSLALPRQTHRPGID